MPHPSAPIQPYFTDFLIIDIENQTLIVQASTEKGRAPRQAHAEITIYRDYESRFF